MTVLHCRKKLIMRSTRSFNLSIIIDGISVPGKVGPKALKLQSHNLVAIRFFFKLQNLFSVIELIYISWEHFCNILTSGTTYLLQQEQSKHPNWDRRFIGSYFIYIQVFVKRIHYSSSHIDEPTSTHKSLDMISTNHKGNHSRGADADGSLTPNAAKRRKCKGMPPPKPETANNKHSITENAENMKSYARPK